MDDYTPVVVCILLALALVGLALLLDMSRTPADFSHHEVDRGDLTWEEK